MKLIKATCCAVFLFMLLSGYTQSPVLSAIESKFKLFSSSFITEKSFAQTDKQFYIAGEIIWFKVYIVDGNFHHPSGLSKIAYVELLDTDLKAVQQAKIFLTGGSGNGSFALPTTLKTGKYSLRVYTNWQKNDGVSSFYKKEITIVNTLQKSMPGVEHAITAAKLIFSAEGGTLVSGIESKVAFKIAGEDGNGEDAQGYIVTEKNDTVIKFKATALGIGHFTFTPKANETYKGVVTLKNGKNITSLLPKAQSSGTVLQLSESGNDIQISITTSKETGSLYCFVHNRMLVQFTAETSIANGRAFFSFPKSIPGDGVSHITVFNSNQEPVGERLYFKQPPENNEPGITLNRSVYSTREPVSLQINSSRQQPAKNIYNLSLSVFRTDSLTNTEPDDIAAHLLLSSELNGQVEMPQYYFSKTTPVVMATADDLMILHAWKNFSWKIVLQNNAPPPAHLPETEGHFIHAKLTHKVTGKPGAETEAYISLPGNKAILQKATSNTDGILRFNMPFFWGPTEFVIQTNETKDTSYIAEIISPFAEQPSNKTGETSFKKFTQQEQDLLLGYSVAMQTQQVYFEPQINQYSVPFEPDTLSFYGKPNAKYKLDDYTRFSSLEEVFREYISQVKVTRRGKVLGLQAEDSLFENYFDEDPLALVDGVPVFNINHLLQFDPLQIQSIEIVTSQYYHGDLSCKGIIALKTYQGNLGGYQLHAGAFISAYEGLQPTRSFYSPAYQTTDDKKSRLPDFRTVLFWKPDIVYQHQVQTINFYTSDTKGSYTIFLQGISENGTPLNKKIKIEVQ